MARVQLIIPDEDRDEFVAEARRDGISLSEWLRLAARERAERRRNEGRFHSLHDLEAFFDECDAAAGNGDEPDWEEHLRVAEKSRSSGWPDT